VSLEDEHAKQQLELAKLKTYQKLKAYQKLSADDILRERAAWAIVDIKLETLLIDNFPAVIIRGENLSSDRKLWGKDPKIWAESDKKALAEYLKKGLTGEGGSPLDAVGDFFGGKKDDAKTDDTKKDEKKGGGLLDIFK